MASGFPPPPVNTIDWDDIGFKVREVNGHIESSYSVKTGKWTEPKFVEDPYLRIHGMAPALNYGQQCYEGLKAFRAPDGNINIFRPSQNAERMQYSSSFISIPQVPADHFRRCCHLAVSRNAEYVPPHETGASMYVRPILLGSCAQLGLNPPEEYTFLVYVLPVGVYHGVKPVSALVLEDFDRSAPDGTGSAKVGGNYAPVLRWSEKAHSEGFGITLHLDSKTRTEIDEFSTSGFIGVKRQGDSFGVVVPSSKNIIKSVTSDSICQIAASFGWTVEARSIPYEELKSFSEVMAAGTAAALVPVKSITMRSKDETIKYTQEGGDDQPGPAFTRLLDTLKGIQLGKIEDQFGWLERVNAPPVEKSLNGTDNGTNGVAENVDKLP